MNNERFWNQRYEDMPWLGSGPSSRGFGMIYKRYLISQILKLNKIESIVDIGCGDLSWLKDDFHNSMVQKGVKYLGVDISSVIIQKNRENFPYFDFEEFDICKDFINRKHDLLICFDVLIHQCSIEEFRNAIKNILMSVQNHALVSYISQTADEIGFIPAIPSALYTQLENEFNKEFVKHKGKFVPAETSNHGELSTWLNNFDSNIKARKIGKYHRHNVYELSRFQWLCFDEIDGLK